MRKQGKTRHTNAPQSHKVLLAIVLLIGIMIVLSVNSVSAAWYDASWSKKKQITNLTSQIAYINVTYDADMQNDFDDIRFVNSGETAELNYSIRSKVDGSSAIFSITTNGASSMYMYYGNVGVSSTGNLSAVFLNPTSVYFFDDNSNDAKGVTNGVNLGTVTYNSTGKYYGSINCDGSTSRVSINGTGAIFSNTNQWSIVTWVVNKTAETSIFGTSTDATWSAGDKVTGMRIRPKASTYTAVFPSEYYVEGASIGSGWQFLVSQRNSTGTSIWQNGALTGAVGMTQNLGTLGYASICFSPDHSTFSGQVSDVMLYSKAITPSDILYLYNVTKNGVIFGSEQANSGMSVVNSIPATASNISTSSVTFGCNASGTGGTNVTSIKLNVTNGVNWTQTISGLNQGSYNATFINSTLGDGTFTWTCIGYGSDGTNATSSSFTFTKDTIPPTINIVYPTNGIHYNINITAMNYTVFQPGQGGGGGGFSSALLTNLLGYFNLDESSGVAIEKVFGIYNGTISGEAQQGQSGIISNAVNMSTVRSSINVTGVFNVNTYPLTINAWTWRYTNNVAGIVGTTDCANPTGWRFDFSSTNNGLSFGVPCQGGVASGISAGFNSWQMVTANWNGSNVKFYINGTLVSTNIYAPTMISSTYYIGKIDTVVGGNIKVDEVGFWNRNLNATEIQELYNSGAGLAYTTSTSNMSVNVSSCWYSTNGGLTNTSITCGNNITSLTSVSGTNVWNVYANNTAGFIGSATTTFVIDDVAPFITWYNPTTGQNPYVKTTFPVNVSIFDLYLDAVNVSLLNASGSYIYTNFTSNITSNATFWVRDLLTLNQGANTLEICARDSLTNSPKINNKYAIIKSLRNNNETDYLNYTSIDGVSPTIQRAIKVIDEKGDKTKLPDYNVTLVDTWDARGEHIKTDIISNKLQTEKIGFVLNYTCVSGCQYLEVLTDRGKTRVVDNNRNLYFQFNDVDLNIWSVNYNQQGSSVVVKIYPKTKKAWEGLPARFTIDPITGGLNKFCSNETIYYDTTAPTISLSSPANNTFSSTTTQNFTVSLSDAGIGVANATFYIYNSAGLYNTTVKTYSNLSSINVGNQLTSMPEGNYNWSYRSCDGLGNCDISSNRTITIDTTYPLISYGVGTLSDGVNVSQNSVYVNVSWTEINFQNITFNLYNSSWLSSTTYSTPTYAINFTNIAQGYYWYNVTITDKANNINRTETRKITLDTGSPAVVQNYTVPSAGGGGGSITISAPNNTWFNQTNITLSGNITDVYGLANATIILYNESGTVINQTSSGFLGGIFNYLIGIPAYLIDGVYRWVVQAYDTASNYVTTEILTFFVDTTPPAFVSQNYNSTWLNNESYIYSLNATITELNKNATGIRFNGTDYSIINITSDVYLYNFTKYLPYVPYSANYYWWAIDNATNYAQSNNYTFNITCSGGFKSFNNTKCVEDIYLPQNLTIQAGGGGAPYCLQVLTDWYKNLSTVGIVGDFIDGNNNLWLVSGMNNISYSNATGSYSLDNYSVSGGFDLYNMTGLTYSDIQVSWTTGTPCSVYNVYGKYFARTRYIPISNTYGGITNAKINLTGYDTSVSNLTALNVSIGNSQVFYADRNFTDVDNRTNNFASAINSYLSSCSYVGSICYVPIRFSSDSAGILRYSDLEWNNLGFYENSQTYNANTYETSDETFSINITYDNNYYVSSTAKFIYNGVSYVGTKTGSGNNIRFTRTVTVPTVVNQTESKSFYWIVALTNSTATENYSSLVYSHNINKLSLVECNASINATGNNVTTINFTIYDTLNPTTLINSNFKANLFYWVGGNGTIKANYTYQNLSESSSSFKLCISPSNVSYYVDADVQFYATGYAINNHYFRNKILNSNISEHSLYLLNSTKATATEVQVIDEYQRGIKDRLIYIQLYNVGTGTYNLVSMAKTNFDGKDIVYLNWLDSFYKFIVTDYNGTILSNYDPYKVASTPQVFQITTKLLFNYDKFNNIQYTLYYNNLTDNVVLTYLDPSSTITAGCLKVISMGANNFGTIYDECAYTTSGTLSYNLAGRNGTFYATFYSLGSAGDIASLEIIKEISTEITDAIGVVEGATYAVIIVGTSFLIGLFSPAAAVIMALVGWIGAVSLGFIKMEGMIAVFVGITFIGLYIAWKLRT